MTYIIIQSQEKELHQGCSQYGLEKVFFVFFATRWRPLLMKMVSTKGNRRKIISSVMRKNIFFLKLPKTFASVLPKMFFIS